MSSPEATPVRTASITPTPAAPPALPRVQTKPRMPSPAPGLAGRSPSLTLPGPAQAAPVEPVHCYALQALAEPGTLPRVLNLFAKRGLVPHRLHVDSLPAERGRGALLAVDLQVRGLDAAGAALIAAGLRQLCAVEWVLTSEKG